MKVQFKRVRPAPQVIESPDSIVPKYGTHMSAGMDLVACIEEPIQIVSGTPAILIPTGIAISMMSSDMVGLIYPRSGLGHKLGLVLGNGVGVIDADYQGELFVSAWNRGQNPVITINPGDRIAQIVFMPIHRVTLTETEEFEASIRGAGGFGSTGK